MTDRVSKTVRRSQLKCDLTNQEAASWWDVWDTGRAVPLECIGVSGSSCAGE